MHKKLRSWVLMVCVFVVMGSTMAIYSQDETESNWCVDVWYPSSEEPTGFESITNNAELIHTVNPFWYSPHIDGTVYTNDPNAESEGQLAEMRDLGLTIMPAIFSSVHSMIMDAETRTFHVNEIVSLVERMDYDGIDIDYEGFPRDTREPFSLFIKELSDALHERGYLLSIAVHAKTTDEGAWDAAYAQDWARIVPAVDMFRIMTYDYSNRNEPPGPIAPVAWVTDVLTYAETITDLSHVSMGLHFYGYSWLRGTPPATTISWASAQRYITSFEPDLERNPDDMELFVDLRVTGLPRQTVYLADAVGLAFKLDLIQEAFPDLGGVSIWGIGGEDPENWDVLGDYITGDCTIRISTSD